MDDAAADDAGRYRALAWAAALGLAAGAFMLWRSFHCAQWINIGQNCGRAFRIFSGQTPYLDFFCPLTPLSFYCIALWFKLFGVSYLTAQAYAAAQCGLAVAVTVYFCRVVLGFSWARSAFMGVLQGIWAPTMMFGQPIYDGDASLYALFSGLFLLAADRKPARARLFAFLSGACAGLAFWAKQDIGAGAIAGACAAVFLLSVPSSGKRRSLFLSFTAGLGLIFGAAAAFFLFKGALREMIYWVFQRAVLVKWGEGKGPGGLSKFISPFTTPVDRSTKYVVLLYGLACASGWIKTLAGRGKDDPALGAVCLVFFGALYAGISTHNGQAYAVSMSYFGVALAVLWRQVERAGGDFGRRRLIFAAVVALYAAIGLRGVHYFKNVDSTRVYPAVHVEASERVRGLRMAAAEDADPLASFIREHIPRQDAFLSFDFNMALYFLTDRLPPVPCTNYVAGEVFPELDERIMIKAASDPKIRWLVCVGAPESLRENDYLRLMPGLLDYLLKNFKVRETRGESPARRFTVWTRRTAA